jgi:hypothetical protein
MNCHITWFIQTVLLLLSAIRVIKAMRIRLTGHVARTGRKNNAHSGFGWKAQRKSGNLEDIRVYGDIIKMNLKEIA